MRKSWIEKILQNKENSKGYKKRRQRTIPKIINRFYIPQSVWDETLLTIQLFGKEQRECYLWWGGYFSAEGDGQILSVFYPEIQSSFGRVHLKTQDLLKMQHKLIEHDQILLAELHSHPPFAGGQNSTDAANSAATYPGFLTIVVPNFGLKNVKNISDTFVYEYILNKKWNELSRSEKENRIIIEDTIIPVEV